MAKETIYDKDQQQLVKIYMEADAVAQERYTIALNRFTVGDISVTDLNYAEQEKDTQPVEPVEASTKIPHASKVSNCCKKQASPSGYYIPEVVAIYSNRPYTTVLWEDGTKTIVKCSEDSHFTEYDGFVCAFEF